MVAQIVTLAEAKLHCRVDTAAEDDLLATYMDAASVYIRNFLNQEIPTNDDSPATYPATIKAAALLIIAGLYEQRSDKIVGTISEDNPAVMNLLYPYRDELGI